MFEPGKEYKTRDGRRARVYAVDGDQSYPIHGAILREGNWEVETWTEDGRNQTGRENSCDLIPPRKTIVRWVNIYDDDRPHFIHGTKELAEDYATLDPPPIACKRIEIDYAEGEFDQ